MASADRSPFLASTFGRVIALTPLARYGAAVGVAIAAISIRWALNPVFELRLPFITFYPAVMLSGWLGGLGPGILTTVLCGLAAEFWWIAPAGSFAIEHPSDLVGIAVFAVTGVLIGALNEAWRRGTGAAVASAERLRVTVSSIGDAVIATDEHGCVTQMNPIAEALTGWSVSDAIGRPFDEVAVLINEHTRQRTESPVRAVLRDGKPVDLANHTVLVARDARETPIDDSAAPIATLDGGLIGAVMVFRDITRRRGIERERAMLLEREQITRLNSERLADELSRLQVITDAALSTLDRDQLVRELLKRIRAVLNSDTATMLLVDQSGTFLTPVASDGLEAEVDPHIRIRLGHGIAGRLAEREGATIVDDLAQMDVVSPILRAQVKSLVGTPLKVDGRLLGVVHAGSWTLRRFTDADARLLTLAADRIAVALDRARLYADVERASRMKDEFLASLSHELRTPLNAVLGYADLLSKGALPPDRVTHAVDAILRNAWAQVRLVESLLDMSRVTGGTLELDLQEEDLCRIVDTALDVVRPAANAKGITFTVSKPPTATVLVCDGDRLEQVLWNLLSNAVKFTLPGGRVTVTIAIADAPDRIAIVVDDNGRGIEQSFLPYVFDRFAQGPRGVSRTPRGLGIGLTLAREIVQAHGGAIDAASLGPGQGSTFTVTLPAQAMRGRRAEAKPADLDQRSLDSLDVLIVDDDTDAREMLALMLESRAASVRTAASAREATAAIANGRPHVLLADLRMPDEDGFTLIRGIRASEAANESPRLAALAVTAHATTQDRELVAAAGFDALISKPVDADDLARTIAGLISQQNV